jgi:hypothetical protein
MVDLLTDTLAGATAGASLLGRLKRTMLRLVLQTRRRGAFWERPDSVGELQ